MSILGSGITDEQAEVFVAAWSGNPMSATSLLNQASVNLANALAAELEAKRPIQVGDRVQPKADWCRPDGKTRVVRHIEFGLIVYVTGSEPELYIEKLAHFERVS